MSTNHLDAVWAKMTTADRFVLLGHDRNYLDDDDRARLTAVLARTGEERVSSAADRRNRRSTSTRRATSGKRPANSGTRR